MDNCPKKDCHEPNALIFKKVVIPASVADDRVTPPKNGEYCNMLVEYEASGNVYIFSSDGIPTLITADLGDINYAELLNKPEINGVELVGDKSLGDLGITDAIDTAVGAETDAREAEDARIWDEIEVIEAGSDVVDVVGTYADLQNYDTSSLQANDLIKVLTDETHSNAISYYRWTGTAFSYVGSEGPYYTENQVDTLLNAKQDTLIAGTNIQIASDGKTISATDTTYTDFTGATSSAAGVNGLVPAPAAGDQDKVLKGDGTWGTVQSGSSYTAGNGINIDANNEISVDTTVVATQTDLASKQDTLTAGTNVQISNNVISATDTTYSNFVGTDGTVAGASGLVPAPTALDDGKFLKADGTWAAVSGGGGTVTIYRKTNNNNEFEGFYSDPSYTTPISGQSIYGLFQASRVIVQWKSTEDSYGEVLRVMRADDGDYLITVFYNLTDERDARADIFCNYVIDDDGYDAPIEVQVSLSDFQEVLTAGSNISIGTVSGVPNTISVTGMPVLYGSQGQNTDGAVTQKVFTDTVGDVESILQILNSGAGV